MDFEAEYSLRDLGVRLSQFKNGAIYSKHSFSQSAHGNQSLPTKQVPTHQLEMGVNSLVCIHKPEAYLLCSCTQ